MPFNIFEDDAFSNVSLTDSMEIVPYTPRVVGNMGLFSVKNPTTHTIFIERKGDKLTILETKPRGSGETTKRPSTRRDLIPFMLPYIPFDDAVTAADVAGYRAFGTEDQLELISDKVNEKLTGLKNGHELTWEWHRIGALKGIILDGDAAMTELLDLFDAFDITQHEVAFDLGGDGAGIKRDCLDIIAYTEDILGGEPYDHIHALVGNDFFQDLVNNEEVKVHYNEQTNYRWGTVQQGTGTQGRGSNTVTFGDITFQNYRGKVGDVSFIEPDEAHFFPVGVPDLFQVHFGPANSMSDVNKPGRDIYVKQELLKFDEGMEMHSESNPLHICRRPKLLVKGYAGAET